MQSLLLALTMVVVGWATAHGFAHATAYLGMDGSVPQTNCIVMKKTQNVYDLPNGASKIVAQAYRNEPFDVGTIVNEWISIYYDGDEEGWVLKEAVEFMKCTD